MHFKVPRSTLKEDENISLLDTETNAASYFLLGAAQGIFDCSTTGTCSATITSSVPSHKDSIQGEVTVVSIFCAR